MALYHLNVRNISRGDGRSAVACAAYRAGETLHNEAEEKASTFGGRRDVLFSEIRAPAGAADWMRERATLWNAVERAEKRKDARLAKEIEFALPRELPLAQWLDLARQMADAYVSRGHIVDLAIHDDGTAHNPHVHLMLTTRAIVGDGFGPKLREADGRQFVQDARALWARIANTVLGAAGLGAIDPRSHAARGITEPPGQHHAPDRDGRRERREERAHMDLHQELITARNELVAAPGIRERYPLLSARPDWPPEQRALPGFLPPEVKAEHDRFWREVQRRALEPERAEELAREDDAVRHEFGVDAGRLLEAAEAADKREGTLAKMVGRLDVRAEFFALRDRMVTEMVRAGLMDPRTAEQVRMVEQKLYPDEFSRNLAAARRNAEVRSQVWGGPEPTRAQVKQLEAIDRAEAEQHLQENTIAFDPATQVPKNSLQRVIAAQWQGPPPPKPESPSEGPAFQRGWLSDLLRPGEKPPADPREAEDDRLPVPDPDGRPIAPAELAQAEERMIKDMEAPARDRIQAPVVDRAPEPERRAAEEAVERSAQIEVPDAEADRYRLAPQESRLDWLQTESRQSPSPTEPLREPARSSSRLDWLQPQPKTEPEQDQAENRDTPDRYQR